MELVEVMATEMVGGNGKGNGAVGIPAIFTHEEQAVEVTERNYGPHQNRENRGRHAGAQHPREELHC